jgi:hypothetical protein
METKSHKDRSFIRKPEESFIMTLTFALYAMIAAIIYLATSH